MQTLNIIGGGKVGTTLGALWQLSGALQVRSVHNRSTPSAEAAVQKIGAGLAAESAEQLLSADLWMVSVSDDSLARTVHTLERCELERAVVFHCSGAVSSNIFRPLKMRGALVASLHPVKSFVGVDLAIRTFPGTYCALEGDKEAVEILRPLVERIGGVPFDIRAEDKIIYHAGTVMVSNFLVSVLECGFRALEKAGVDRALAAKVIEPMIQETLRNSLTLGTAQALSGPITRGDAVLVMRQLEALSAWDEQIANVYRVLGSVAVDLAQERGDAAPESLRHIIKALTPG